MSKPRATFFRAFVVSVLGTGMSRVLGAVRDVVVAGFLGAGAVSDAFWIAFTVPNVFRRFVADEGLTGALVPAVAKAEAEEGEAEAHALADRVFTALLVANLVLCALGIWAAPWLVKAFAWSFTQDPAQFALAVDLTRLLFPFVAMVSMVSLFEGLLNHRGHFFVPKVAPGLVSVGMAGAALTLGDVVARPVDAVVIGVLAGGLAHVLIHVPVLHRLWGPLRPRGDWADPRFRGILTELSKVVAIGIFAQINILVLRQLAAMVGEGAITRYWYANRVVDLAQGIIAVAIGSAMLPHVAASVAAADWRRFQTDLVSAFRLAAFLLMPAAAVLLAFAEPVVAILFRRGAYTAADVHATAVTLVALVPFMLSVAAINLLKKVYFALDDRNTLLGVGALGVATTGALGVVLVDAYGETGLGLALSLATLLQATLYAALLRRRLGAHLGLGELVRPVIRIAIACLPVLAVLTIAARAGDWSVGAASARNLGLVAGGLTASALAYLVAAYLLRLEELHRLVGVVRRRTGR